MELFEKAVSKSKEYAKAVEQKAGEAYDLAKTRYKIMDVKNQISKRYEEIGKNIYAHEKSDTEDEVQPEIEGLIEELDMLNAELESLKENLACLKGQRICGNCKANIGKDDPYCRYCGNKTQG